MGAYDDHVRNGPGGAPATLDDVHRRRAAEGNDVDGRRDEPRDVHEERVRSATATRIIGNAECKIGESKILSHSVMTLTGDTAYRTDVTASYDPPFMGMKESKTTLEGKYVGPCRDGLVPGDFIGPNGQKFNLKGIASHEDAARRPFNPQSPAKAPQ